MSRVEKIHFAYTFDTFSVSMGLETVSESVLKDTLMCVEHNLVYFRGSLEQFVWMRNSEYRNLNHEKMAKGIAFRSTIPHFDLDLGGKTFQS